MYRGAVGHFLAKRKGAIAPPPTASLTPLTSEGLYGTHFLTLTPHYSSLTVWPQAFVIPYPKQKTQTPLTSSTNGPVGGRFS